MAENPREDIMEATYDALCKHGYADLTIEKIADEFDKGKSLIYYHFDDKQSLIIEFLDSMALKLEQDFEELDKEGEKRLHCLLDMMLAIENDEMRDFHRALADIQGRAQYNEELADKFRQIDEVVKSEFRNVLNQMNQEDREIKAEILLSAVHGAFNRRLTLGDNHHMQKLKSELLQRIID